jgi:hypothetical protein
MRGCAFCLVLVAAGACAKGSSVAPSGGELDAPSGSSLDVAAVSGDTTPSFEPFCSHRATDPARTIVERPCGTPRAVLTDGARSVVLTRGERVLAEPGVPSSVRTSDWVRVLPAAFGGTLDDAQARWLDASLADDQPDLLAMALEYIQGAPPLVVKGLQIAGDAGYGPLGDGGVRLEGADFNDYLGLRWIYPDGTVGHVRGDMAHDLDCSGYMRMLWGYRAGLPLASGPSNTALSRRAVQLEASTFGVTIIASSEPPALHLDRLGTGDLVFFDADPGDGPAVDHVGMYLGLDQAGRHRFISSRKTADGPTLGDDGGVSLLDGGGLYARAFRSVRRL